VRGLAALPAGHLRLAVLDGCETAGVVPGGDGIQTLLLPFLAAGVPTVVATLWPVDDELAVGLMTAFHRQVAAGVDPATALRAAKLTYLHNADSRYRAPASWAPFIVIGGAAGGVEFQPR